MSTVEPNAPDGRGETAVRRQLTILFCDLVDSTVLSSTMDPEDLHDLMVAFQRYCAERIEDAGGFVARFAGDGILAYFGYPVALEDAPQRAVQAALALRAAHEHLTRPDGLAIAVRIGVATGPVVVGDLVSQGAREHAVAGETPNLAARLQALAEPDTVLISETTKRLTDGVFAFRSLGPVRHKGFPKPAVAWEVLGPRATVSRYEGRRAIGLSPLVSREPELEIILHASRVARETHSCVVGITGDPGIGKSRLLEEARGRIGQDDSILWLEGGGASVYDHTPFYVASQILRPLATKAHDGRPSGTGPLADLLGAEAGRLADDQGDPGRRRDDLMGLLTQLVWAAAERQPTVLVVEDLHWVDPSTLELLDLIVRAEGLPRILLIYTSRIDFSDRWPRSGRHWVIPLTRLDDPGSATLARAAGGEVLSLAQIEAVVSQAAGVPLYVEELARLIADHPAAALDQGLPPTLSDLLAARLEAAGPAKRHAQMASVLGQEFSASLFVAMTEQDGADAEAALAELEARSIIVRRGGDTCAFRHALIAAAAYDTLLKRERRELHERAAGITLDRFPALAENHPEVVARHWTQAGKFKLALDAWEASGSSANLRRAFREAEHAYRQALSVLERAGLREPEKVELKVRVAFNRVLQITQGYSSTEVSLSAQRVTELADLVGDPIALAREEQVKWRSVLVSGDFAKAQVIVDRVMSLMQDEHEARWPKAFSLRAGIQQGFYTGDLARGERDFLAWDAIRDGSHRGAGDDTLSMGIGGLIAQLTGRHSVALGRIGAAFEIAAQRGNPYDLAMALHSESGFHNVAQDADQLALSAVRLADVAAEGGFEYASHLAVGWQAVVDINAGRVSHGIERCAAAIAGFDRIEAGISQIFWLGVLARAQALDGDAATALRTFERAFAYNRLEFAFVPETYLARAGVFQALGREQEAKRDLAETARVAAGMGASLYEFRALTELSAMHLASHDDAAHRRALQAAEALSHLDHCPADRARFEAVKRSGQEPPLA